MGFSDPETLGRRLKRCTRGPFVTIECGHDDAKSGIIVRVEVMKVAGGIESLIIAAVERAALAAAPTRRVSDPGWWAGLVCVAALEAGYPASIMRGAMRSCVHGCLIVPRGGLLDAWPAWPLLKIGAGGALRDLRGEAACRLGPSDADLIRYANAQEVDASVGTLRMLFDQGVLEWSAGEAGPVIRAAR